MKKLFISCPMRGRTKENIKDSMDKMHKIAEIMMGEELEVIPTYIEDVAYDRESAIRILGNCIQSMADADVFIGIRDSYDWRGCNIENQVAQRYRIKYFLVDSWDFMPDVVDIARNKL